MKRRGPSRALVALAVAGLVACIGSTAQAQENIYENTSGLMGGSIVPTPGGPTTSDFVIAGPRLNPNGVGQYLVGPYYDVRPVGEDQDAQAVNIQIINTNTNNTALPVCTADDVERGIDGAGCYNPTGGILFKIRFRESKLSREVLDFVVPISCGEVWAGVLELTPGVDPNTALPRVRSKYPIATGGSGAVTIISDDLLNTATGQSFVIPPGIGLTARDVQRGYIEVIAMEALNCEPDDGELNIDQTETWTRLTPPQDPTPSNALGAEALRVRVGSGVAHGYNFVAISAFVGNGLGSIAPQNLFANSNPDWNNCIGVDINFNPYTGIECVRQVNLALSKSRLISQYDVSTLTAGTTDVVVTLPTKYANCGISAGANANFNSKIYPQTSFQCVPTGEEIACTVYNREEDFDSPENPPFSPSPPEEVCVLPRELTIFHISEAGGTGNLGDVGFATGNLVPSDSGWLDLDLARNAQGVIVHQELFPNTTTHDILGAYLAGYNGLPATGLVSQEYFNGNVGGTYGVTVPSLAEQVVLKPGQS